MSIKEIEYVGKIKYTNKYNNYVVPIHFSEDDTVANKKTVRCIFDTGCTVTTLTRATCKKLGIDKYKAIGEIKINGVVGNLGFELIEVPTIIFAYRIFKDVKVARYRNAGGYDLIGLNILEHLKYYIDTEEKEIYFLRNPKPNVPERYKSEGVFCLNPEDDEENTMPSLSSLSALANRTVEPNA